MAINDRGKVYAWGKNDKGKLGLKVEDGQDEIKVPTAIDKLNSL